jgi:hypothetical protein
MNKREKAIRALENRREAVDLRRKGKTYQQIADIMNMSVSSIHKTITVAMAKLKEEIEQDGAFIRALELDRLDNLQYAYWTAAMDGDINAGSQVLRIMERRAKLMGIDLPDRSTQNQVSGVMIVPAMTDPEVWGVTAAKSQEQLKNSVRE